MIRKSILLLECVAIVVFVCACTSGNSEGPGEPHPTSTAQVSEPSPNGSEYDSFREFASSIGTAITNHDLQFFSYHAASEEINVSIWRSDDQGAVPAVEAVSLIGDLWRQTQPTADDQFGSAEPQLYALGLNRPPPPDSPSYLSVLTGIIGAGQQGEHNSEPLRVALVLEWQKEAGEWRFNRILKAFQLSEDLLEPTEIGKGYIWQWEKF